MKADPENNQERDQLTGDEIMHGHEYDGIQELNNKLPRWWLGLFYITIIIGVIYILRFHVLKTAPLQEEEYLTEMAAFEQTPSEEAPAPSSSSSGDEATVTGTRLTDAASLEGGKTVYDKNCAVCHLAQGQGLVGPNLTDAYWIHGGSFEDIVKVINTGVIEKGMIAWKDMLSVTDIQQVASFIMSLQGTNPPNPKAQEGTLFNPGS
ncbi:MAG TPA: cbb3-type cytochrome c oxidase N-terminal domain-containing protein [Bacteroidales bacterium]|nr:cbb3-type cytochrome c oxidase N-terminal domain-containing protein [Bacteroidales bacterium]